VAADLHCNGFGNASPHHVANSTPSQVMEQQTNVPRLVVFPSLGAGRTFAVASQCGSGAAFRAYHPPETAGAAESLPVIAEDSYRLTIRPRENKIIRTLPAQHAGRSTKTSFVITTTRPSSFLVVPGSSRIVRSTRLTCRIRRFRSSSLRKPNAYAVASNARSHRSLAFPASCLYCGSSTNPARGAASFRRGKCGTSLIRLGVDFHAKLNARLSAARSRFIVAFARP